MFFFLSAYILLICSCFLPLQCLLSSPYQMSSCRQRAGTAYRCVHEGTVMERHPLAANTDLRQHPAHDCLTGTFSLPCKKHTQTESSSSSPHSQTEHETGWNFNDFNGKTRTREHGSYFVSGRMSLNVWTFSNSLKCVSVWLKLHLFFNLYNCFILFILIFTLPLAM